VAQSTAKLDHEIEVLKIIKIMVSAYPNTQITDATREVYVTMLHDLPLNVLESAIKQAMAESEFLPTIAKIRDKAIALTRPGHVSSLEAWGIIKKAMEQVGFYRYPTFDDSLIAKAVECIGWQTLCSSENEPADRAHFAKVYESLVRREDEDARMLPEVRQIQQKVRALIADHSIPDTGSVN
jgi:hypothetical protein